MAWFLIAFFGIIALCALAYLAMRAKDLLSPETECEAVVEKRYTENFPMTMGFVKRDRKELHLAFRLESGELLDAQVGDALYKQCPAGTRGRLAHRGRRLVRFDVTAAPQNEEIN